MPFISLRRLRNWDSEAENTSLWKSHKKEDYFLPSGSPAPEKIVDSTNRSTADAACSATVKIERHPDLKDQDKAEIQVAYFSANDTTRAIGGRTGRRYL